MLYITAEPDVLETLVEDAPGETTLGVPRELDSELDALDSPIGADEILVVTQVVTAVATSGVAVTALVEKVVRLARTLRKPIEVGNDAGAVTTVTEESTAGLVLEALDLAGP